jgi:hypothetical protein
MYMFTGSIHVTRDFKMRDQQLVEVQRPAQVIVSRGGEAARRPRLDQQYALHQLRFPVREGVHVAGADTAIG